MQAEWISLRNEGPAMQGGHAALLAMARGLVLWHEAEAASLAAATVPVQGGHARCPVLPPAPLWQTIWLNAQLKHLRSDIIHQLMRTSRQSPGRCA